jgi:hypothetical protein
MDDGKLATQNECHQGQSQENIRDEECEGNVGLKEWLSENIAVK